MMMKIVNSVNHVTTSPEHQRGDHLCERQVFSTHFADNNFSTLQRFSVELPMPAALAFLVIPAKAGIQRQAKQAGTTRG
jgi:hypothetical protein